MLPEWRFGKYKNCGEIWRNDRNDKKRFEKLAIFNNKRKTISKFIDKKALKTARYIKKTAIINLNQFTEKIY